MDAYTALALTRIRAEELQGEARRDSLARTLVRLRTTTLTTGVRPAATCATCPA